MIEERSYPNEHGCQPMNVDEYSALWAAGPDTYDAGQALDPEDWEHFRVLGRRIVDDMVDYLARVRDRPVWCPVPDNVRAVFREPAPPIGRPADRVYEEFRKTILPYPRGNIHPRFWGWVNGSGIPVATYADFLASVMNCTLGAGENSAMMVEEQTIEWLKEMFAWPGSGSGGTDERLLHGPDHCSSCCKTGWRELGHSP
jgi:hypothetical protein